MLSVDERLARWLPYERSFGWLGDAARIIIPKLERELAAQRIEARSDETPKERDDGV